jgi:formylglycine-generating enzyme required for sulfatase activity
MAAILVVALSGVISVSHGAWKLRVHRAERVDEYVLSEVDSLAFVYDLQGMVLIPSGTFTMGSPTSEPAHESDESQHQVILTASLYVSQHETTQAEWQGVMGWNQSSFPGADQPVENVTWLDCLSYCNKRSAAENLDSVYVMTGRSYSGVHITGVSSISCAWDSNGYRLLTEAEWEYACRAGSTAAFCNGGITNVSCSPMDPNLDQVGWYCGNAGSTTHDVGGKAANAWGLEGVHGNLWEWCWDWYGIYPTGTVVDPLGPSSGTQRVCRGGCYYNYAKYCRSANREDANPGGHGSDIGLRVARAAQ